MPVSSGRTSNMRKSRWNGTIWSALGSGMNEYVYALAVVGGNVYAGGQFTTAGGAPANRIARWNGTAWTALGSGVNADVDVLALTGSDLYTGGHFLIAGDKTAAYAAKAYLVVPPGGWFDSIAASNGVASLALHGNPGHGFDIQRTTDLLPPGPAWSNVTTALLWPAADGSFGFADTNAPPDKAVYRSVEH